MSEVKTTKMKSLIFNNSRAINYALNKFPLLSKLQQGDQLPGLVASPSCQCILTALPRPPSGDRGNSLGPLGLVAFMCLINEDKLVRSGTVTSSCTTPPCTPQTLTRDAAGEGEEDRVLSLGGGAVSGSIPGSCCCLE